MKKIKVVMDKYEYGLIVHALNDYRNQMIKNGEDIDYITEILEKWLEKN